MKALTLLQPYASLMAWSEKRFETRSFKVSYRGELAITASKNWKEEYRDLCYADPFLSAIKQNIPDGYDFDDKLVLMPVGAVVAVGTLDSIITSEEWMTRHERKMPSYNDQEMAFGNYQSGRWAWRFVEMRILRTPVPCRGMQMLWNLPGSVEAEVRRQLV